MSAGGSVREPGRRSGRHLSGAPAARTTAAPRSRGRWPGTAGPPDRPPPPTCLPTPGRLPAGRRQRAADRVRARRSTRCWQPRASSPRVVSAVAALDGGVYALLTPADRRPPRVAGDGWGRLRDRGRRARAPRVEDSGACTCSADRAVAVTGRHAGEGYGLRVVDPRPVRCGRRSCSAWGARPTWSWAARRCCLDRRLALPLPDRRQSDARQRRGTARGGRRAGQVPADRDLADDVARRLAPTRSGRQLAGLLPWPAGGVTLLLDVSPDRGRRRTGPRPCRGTTPPSNRAGRFAGHRPRRRARIPSRSPEPPTGTVLLLVAVRERLVAAASRRRRRRPAPRPTRGPHRRLRPGGPAGAGGRSCRHRSGSRALDLTTGERSGRSVSTATAELNVRALYPTRTAGRRSIGECDTPREDTQFLVFLGPVRIDPGVASGFGWSGVFIRNCRMSCNAVPKGRPGADPPFGYSTWVIRRRHRPDDRLHSVAASWRSVAADR